MDQGEPNRLKMLNPQKTDVGGTEGEESVSPVILELISRVMGEKKSINSDMHINPEGYQGSGAINSFVSPSISSILGYNQKARTFPSLLGRELFFMALDHSQGETLTPI
ncbi:hypothetical protein O181_023866 [Austropuccinia psidii MF-1]|uniref:Uncharacterized protein n=1 Tax=Austropuccinia psidii MF-1 TaxID=1389203 RepID=A0A9Q3GY24_9BASI|nr:hypothetical protein [Austropuccinia psidii MF-1]